MRRVRSGLRTAVRVAEQNVKTIKPGLFGTTKLVVLLFFINYLHCFRFFVIYEYNSILLKSRALRFVQCHEREKRRNIFLYFVKYNTNK